MDMERGLTKRVDRHRQVLNRLEDGLEILGVKQDSVLSEIERLSRQVCRCRERGSASETSQLSYASPPMAGASSASSAGYEDADDQEGEEGGREKKMSLCGDTLLQSYSYSWTGCTWPTCYLLVGSYSLDEV